MLLKRARSVHTHCLDATHIAFRLRNRIVGTQFLHSKCAAARRDNIDGIRWAITAVRYWVVTDNRRRFLNRLRRIKQRRRLSFGHRFTPRNGIDVCPVRSPYYNNDDRRPTAHCSICRPSTVVRSSVRTYYVLQITDNGRKRMPANTCRKHDASWRNTEIGAVERMTLIAIY